METPGQTGANEIVPVKETEAPVAEVKTEAAPIKQETAEKDSQRFLALKKREQALQKQREEIQKLKAEAEQKHSKVAEWEALKASAAKNPFKALEALGVTYDQLTEKYLNEGKAGIQTESVKEEFEAYKKQQQDEREAQLAQAREQAKAQEEQAVENYKEELEDFIGKEAETYELINLHLDKGAIDLIYETIQEHWNKQIKEGVKRPKILSTKEAAELVENFYFDYTKKLSATKKFKALANPEKKEVPVTQETPQQALERTAKAPQASTSAAINIDSRTEADRIKRALAALGH